MSQKYEIGVYVDSYARVEAQRVVFPLIEKFGSHTDIIPMMDKLDELPQKLAVVGGEGSNRAVIQNMYDLGQYRPIGIVGGGTRDVLYHYLKKTGRVITVAEFIDTPPDKFLEKYSYRPGQANDETGATKIFNNHIAVGNYEAAVGALNERLRILPSKIRSGIVYRAAYISAVVGSGEDFNMVSVSGNIGNVDAFDQELFGSDVTHAWIEGGRRDQARKLAKTLTLWQRGQRPPETVLKLERKEIFNLNNHSQTIWIDGDTIKNPFRGDIFIKRAETAIPIFALVK